MKQAFQRGLTTRSPPPANTFPGVVRAFQKSCHVITSPTVPPPWRETPFPQISYPFPICGAFFLSPRQISRVSRSPKAEARCATQGSCPLLRRHGEVVRQGSQPGPSRLAAGAGRVGGANVSLHCRAIHRLLQRNTLRATNRLPPPQPLAPLAQMRCSRAARPQTAVPTQRARKPPRRSAPPLAPAFPECLPGQRRRPGATPVSVGAVTPRGRAGAWR
jgi:hypothetical protein